MLNEECILRDFLSITTLEESASNNATRQGFAVAYKTRLITIETTIHTELNAVSCVWSCEGYIFCIVADHLTRLCKDIERWQKGE